MISRIIIAAAVALFFTPAARVLSQEHPEHPSKGAAATKKGGAEKRMSTADISTGIKRNIKAETKRTGDGKFHVQHNDQKLPRDLIKVHDDGLQKLGAGRYFACA